MPRYRMHHVYDELVQFSEGKGPSMETDEFGVHGTTILNKVTAMTNCSCIEKYIGWRKSIYLPLLVLNIIRRLLISPP